MWIEYHFDRRYNNYCIIFCLEYGAQMGDIELCKGLNISLDIFNNEISSKSYIVKKEYPYPNSNYVVTYFIYEEQIKEFTGFLESCLVQKMLRGG